MSEEEKVSLESDGKWRKVMNSPVVGCIDTVVAALEKQNFGTVIFQQRKYVCGLGQWGILISGTLIAINSFLNIFAENGKDWSMLGFVLAAVVIAAISNYAAVKIFPVLDVVIRKSPCKIASSAIFKVGALLSFCGMIFGVNNLLHKEVLSGILEITSSGLMIFLFLDPSIISIEFDDEVSVGDTAVALVAFFVKSCLAILPFVFAVFSLWSIFEAIDFLRNGGLIVPKLLWLTIGFLPLFAYLSYLLYFLLFELILSVLAIPGKIDQLTNNNPNHGGK